MKKIAPVATLSENHTLPGITDSGKMSMIGNQPPKNKIADKALINNIFEYSPKKNNAKVIAEYSSLYPETSSASAAVVQWR